MVEVPPSESPTGATPDRSDGLDWLGPGQRRSEAT